MTTISFEKNEYLFSEFLNEDNNFNYDSSQRYIGDLLFPKESDEYAKSRKNILKASGNHKLAQIMHPLALIIFSFSIFIHGKFDRRDKSKNIIKLMASIIIFQIFDKERIKSLIAILIVIPTIFFTAYQSSDFFQLRVDKAISQTIAFSDPTNPNKHNSLGVRLNFAKNSFEVFSQNIILGVGTGDFPNEYNKINKINSPKMPKTTNPHNMYTLIGMQLGLIGLVSMLSIFYYQIKLSFSSSNKFIRDLGVTLPLVFLVIMLSDSYLLGHFTTLVFVFFSSFLYKDFEKS